MKNYPVLDLIKHLVKRMECTRSKCYATAVYTVIMVVLSLQLLSTVERQVFDFLGYMWAPIIGNFFQIICTILGIFGTYQYRPRFIAVYSTWTLVWLGWNVFVICLYLEVGVLNRNREIYILNIGTRNKSWWLEHGIGCKINNDTWLEKATKDTARPIPPEEFVEGCLLDYYYVEVIHAGVQCLLALMGFIFTCTAIYMFTEEEESLFVFYENIHLCRSKIAPFMSSPANDELEFVKMRYQAPQNREENTRQEETRIDLNTTTRTGFHTLEGPPSYETSMRDAAPVNHYHYGSDRQSVRSARSARSARSKASTRSKSKQQGQERREDLPWVQIAPSSHTDEAPYRHFP